MLRQTCLATTVLFGLAAPAFATSPEVYAAVDRYMALPAVQAQIDAMLDVETIVSISEEPMAARGMPVDPAMHAKIVAFMTPKMGPYRAQLVDSLREGYAADLTVEEIEALIAFHDSPLGGSAMAKMAPVSGAAHLRVMNQAAELLMGATMAAMRGN